MAKFSTNNQPKRDPADALKAAKEQDRLEQDLEQLDISNIDFGDFKTAPKEAARVAMPFDGYPFKPAIRLDTYTDPKTRKEAHLDVSATFIVALNPNSEPPQDPSGRGMSIMDQKTKQERVVDIKTVHSRFLRDYDNGGINTDVVFDRELTLKGGKKVMTALVKSHSLRAQLMFRYNEKHEPGRIEVEDRYLFLDMDQKGRLQRLFQLIINPKIRLEQMSRMVSGETEASDESLAKLPTAIG